MGRRRRVGWVVLSLATVALIVWAVQTDVQAHNRATKERQSLAHTRTSLAKTRYLVSAVKYAQGLYGAKLKGLQASVASTLSQSDNVQQALDASNKSAYILGVDIGMLHTCLGGVNAALMDIKGGRSASASTDISGVSSACLAVDGDSTGGPVYPFDFPDPFVLRVGNTYFGYATNSAEGNIQINSSTDLAQWTAVGNALPHLPAWAKPGGTWAPSVLQIGRTFVLYYSAVVAGRAGGEECISAATSTSPTGPFADHSTAPLECQSTLGGSIDPSPFTAANGTPYLEWKSNGGSGQPAALWSEQLNGAGTGFAGTAPTQLLTANQRWEAGVVEAPDLVPINGRDYLFYSGNNWNSANYAVGVALCSGPLGPCNALSSGPILASGPGMAGPGGETVFTDTSGALWMAFDAWLPGSVGYPHSRDLYLRQLIFSGNVPVVQAG